jgi:hypothetical protein
MIPVSHNIGCAVPELIGRLVETPPVRGTAHVQQTVIDRSS